MLSTRLSALKRVSRDASFMSILVYMVAVSGGTENYIIKAVQVMQNKEARCITKLGWFTPTRSLLLQCNWLSIKQLTFFHTALQVWKVKQYKCPVYINSKYQPSNTRSSTQGTLLVPVVEKSTSSKSFMIRSAATWNTLPPTIRNIMKLNTFKKRLKEWTRENIDIE